MIDQYTMGNQFEVSNADSPPSSEDDPLPLTPELLTELLLYIKDLWEQHRIAKQDGNPDLRAKIEEELSRAYGELEDMQEEVGKLLLPADLREVTEFEYWFACTHLRKVLKYVIY